MKRLRVFFAVLLFIFFLPIWRLLDYQVMMFPATGLYTASFLFTALCFVIFPIRLLKPINKKVFFISLTSVTALVWFGSPLSNLSTLHPELRHCGASTYSGFFYHLRILALPAQQDDLEVRNQMCWMRKIVLRTPETISDVQELKNYLEVLRKKLLKPDNKFKASLPLIALAHGKMSVSLSGNAFESVEIGKLFIDSQHFWKSQYTIEISRLTYPWYAWPYSSYIQWEYSFIEDNWEAFVGSLSLESQ